MAMGLWGQTGIAPTDPQGSQEPSVPQAKPTVAETPVQASAQREAEEEIWALFPRELGESL